MLIAAVIIVALIFLAIRSIENDQPARSISRKRSRAQRDLRDALAWMRRR